MPMILAAVVGAIAAAAVASAVSGAVILGFTIGATLATIIGGVAGLLVSAGTSFAFRAFTKNKSSSAAASPLKSSAQDSKVMVRSSVEPRRVVYGLARVSGPIAYAGSSGENNQNLHLVVLLAGHRVAEITTVWLNDDPIEISDMVGAEVKSGKFAEYVQIQRYTGAPDQAADPLLIERSPDGWDASHRLQGIAYLYIQLSFNRDLFQGGVPNVSALVKGKADIFDPRTSVTGWSDNWALCIRDYLVSAHGLACDSDEIDDDTFEAAANLADEDVQIAADATTQKRYTVNGSFTLDRAPVEVMDEMIDAGGGALVYVAGKYRLYGGAYSTPGASIGVSDFAGPLRVVTRPSRRDLFNSVRGTFVDPARFWQASEFAPVIWAASVIADGETIWRDVEMPWITDHYRTQRLAAQIILRHRFAITIEAPLRYSGLTFAVWDMVEVTHPDFGWTDKPFRIVGWEFGPADGTINVTMQEEQDTSYDWLYDQAGALPVVPRTTLASPFSVSAPGGLTVTDSLYQTREGAGLRVRVALSWLPVPSPFVQTYQVQYRPVGTAAWITSTGSTGTAAEVLDLAPGAYEFRVRGDTGVGHGSWATVSGEIGGLLAAAPSAVTGFGIQSIGGMAFLRWDRHPDIDVRVGGRFEVRHTPTTSSATWSGSTSIGEAVPGDTNLAIVPLKAGTYFVRAVDAGGNYGAAASIQTTQATALAWANLDSLTEHTGFTGAKTDTIVVSSALRLDATGDLDGEADFDAILAMDRLGATIAEGSYAFSGGIDLGAVASVRATSRLIATISNDLADWDDQADPIDSWATVDGVFGGEADAWVEVRTTQDNPSGSPTWEAWRRLDSAEFTARGFQFRAQLRSYNPSYNIAVAELEVSVDEVA